jgi:hypothetical protein
MAKQVKTTTAPSAWVVNSNDSGRKSIKKGKVYLSDKEEFKIELYNPLQDCVLADIKLNGKSISQTGLVLNPGQRFYLDCFIDDKKKFIFNTYEVDDSTETMRAIEKNGLLEVFFYKESVVSLNNWSNRFNKVIVERYYTGYPWYPWGTYYNGVYSSGSGNITTGLTTGSTTTNLSSFTTNTANSIYTTGTNVTLGSNTLTNTGAVDLSNLNNNAYYSSNLQNIGSTTTSYTSSSNIETGRIEKGSKSEQKFETVDMDFDNYYIASTIIQLLPDSRKPVETKDIMKHSEYVNIQHDIFDLLQKLSDLHKQNILTDDEFKEKKDEILSKI